MKLLQAWKAFMMVLKGEELVPKSSLHLAPTPTPKPAAPLKPELMPERFEEGAMYTLLLLQREGRLIDFLQESIDGYADDQIGAAVRQIHGDCQAALNHHFSIQPVRSEDEQSQVEIPDGFDATELRLTGNLPESGPYKGALAHRGWRADKVNLPQRTGAVNTTIIQPAEVEVGG